MDKVGIPRGLFYYYYGDLWKYFFECLSIDYVVSEKTNKAIMNKGLDKANDEMCLALKNYLGHVSDLCDKCDYIMIPKIDNLGLDNQMCTNFLAVYEIVCNLFDVKVLTYDINLDKGYTLKKGLINIGLSLGRSREACLDAYERAYERFKILRMSLISNNMNSLNSSKYKILIVSHPYNIYDDLIGKDIINYLSSNEISIIYSDRFDDKIMNKLSTEISSDLYFKYCKDNLGAIVYCQDKVDGIIFISAFPCGPDSLANLMAMRWVKVPYINLILDDNSSFTGIETRLESFIDMLRGDFVD